MLRFLLDEHISPSERTYRPQNLAGITDALIRIWDGMHAVEWTDRVTFASRPR
jgi:hypothetical protein